MPVKSPPPVVAQSSRPPQRPRPLQPPQSPVKGSRHPQSPYTVKSPPGGALPAAQSSPPATQQPQSPPPRTQQPQSPPSSRAGSQRRAGSPAPAPPAVHAAPPPGWDRSPSPAPSPVARPPYDHRDRAPEDRASGRRCLSPQLPQGGRGPWWQGVFPAHSHVVCGSVVIEGVNYSVYESLRGCRGAADLEDGIRDDLISEVGSGVRREDVAITVTPGAIKSVVLHYAGDAAQGGHFGARSPPPPRLVDADWCLKVDYAIRVRDTELQRAAACALYRALTGPHGFSALGTATAYAAISPERGEGEVRIRAASAEPAAASGPPSRSPPARARQQQRLLTPPLSALPPPPPAPPLHRMPQHGPAPSPGRSPSEQQAPPHPPAPYNPAGSPQHAPPRPPPARPLSVSPQGQQSQRGGSASPSELREALDEVRALEGSLQRSDARVPIAPAPADPRSGRVPIAQVAAQVAVAAEVRYEVERDRELVRLADEIAQERERVRRRLTELSPVAGCAAQSSRAFPAELSPVRRHP
eukprot:TRINITY_DN12207_c0_g1_i2.p1 TRINITY_DN12207_c0_g1~~TRINITY_DN12207_c0_g1_i2.p1  ORF type:complete len:552 (+),score=141.66 TRINITY_DN12207_c0_g1_i2:79-1656(+)